MNREPSFLSKTRTEEWTCGGETLTVKIWDLHFTFPVPFLCIKMDRGYSSLVSLRPLEAWRQDYNNPDNYSFKDILVSSVLPSYLLDEGKEAAVFVVSGPIGAGIRFGLFWGSEVTPEILMLPRSLTELRSVEDPTGEIQAQVCLTCGGFGTSPDPHSSMQHVCPSCGGNGKKQADLFAASRIPSSYLNDHADSSYEAAKLQMDLFKKKCRATFE